MRYGVPESLSSWAQELGRGGRDGKPATATILYSMSNVTMQWPGYVNITATQNIKRILKEFLSSWRYIMADLAGMCRHKGLLSSFGEDAAENNDSDNCCDVCKMEI